MQKKSFTLVELMIVIAILAILSAIVIFALNPARLFDNFRDSKRITDITAINKGIIFLESWNANGITYGTSTNVYLSLPDSSSTCSSYSGLPTLATGYSYYCVTSTSYKNTDGTGWIPINFTVDGANKYLSSLPVDPTNDSTYFYSYFPGGSYELRTKLANVNDATQKDDGISPFHFEIGSPNRIFHVPIPVALLVNGDATLDKFNFSGMTSIATDDYVSAPKSFRADNYLAAVKSDTYIPIDIKSTYRVSGYFKSVGSGGLSRLLFGFATYDKDFNLINCGTGHHRIASETYLTQPLTSGDTIAYVNSVTGWDNSGSASSKRMAVYNYQNYPAYTYTMNAYYYTSVNTSSNYITLTSAYSGVTIPSGTKVANSYDCGYMYAAAGGGTVPNTWTFFTGTVSGLDIYDQSDNKWRNGTKYIKALFYLNYTNDATYSMLVDDVKIEFVK